MSSHPSIDAATLLARWQSEGHLAAEAAPKVAAAIAAAVRDAEPPIYLKILTAVGTAVATVFFLGFLGVSGLISFDKGTSLMVWAAIFLAMGIGLALSLRAAAPGLGRDFAAQSAFVALALGKVLAVGGAAQIWGFDKTGVVTATLLVVTILTYPVSGSSLDRLLSPYAVAGSALFDLTRSGGDLTAGLTLYHLVATAVAGGLLLSHRMPAGLRPVGLAALAAMGTVVCLIASGHDFGIWVTRQPIDVRPIEAILTLSLIGTVAWVAGGFERLARPPLAAATVAVAALGFAGAPGLIFALIVLLVGHARHDVPMRVVGILALPAFLVLWYYGRDMSFLQKSAALVGSGALLLAARGVMARQGWDREEAP